MTMRLDKLWFDVKATKDSKSFLLQLKNVLVGIHGILLYREIGYHVSF